MALLDEDRTLVLIGVGGARGGSDRVLGLVERALAMVGLDLRACDAVAVSRGPGSLTGLRVGIGTARGLAAGAGKPLIGVSTLQALACCAGGTLPVLALLDAGRGEVYGGLFHPGDPPRSLGEERVGSPEEFARAVSGRDVRLAGPGAERFRDIFDVFPGAGPLSLPAEEFLAVGIGRVAGALWRTGGDLDPAPRYLRRHPAPVHFPSADLPGEGPGEGEVSGRARADFEVSDRTRADFLED